MSTGQWNVPEERADITARVAAINATVEAERKAMENRLTSLEASVSRGVSRALQLLAGLAVAMLGGVISIHVQLARNEERQAAADKRYSELHSVLDQRIQDLDRRLDDIEHSVWMRENDPEPRKRTRQVRP